MNQVDFQIADITNDGLIIGCNCGIEIPLGFTFNNTAIQDNNGISCKYNENGTNISLSINEIHFNGKMLTSIPLAHIVGLKLNGQGAEDIKRICKSLHPLEYLHLRG